MRNNIVKRTEDFLLFDREPLFIVLSLGPTVVNLKTHTVNVSGCTKLTDGGTLRMRNRAVHNTYTIIQSAVTCLRGAT